MGQVRHGCATTTHAVRAAIQRSQASTAALSRELGINPKTVAKWRKRETVEDRKTGPKEPRSSILSEEEEAMVVAFRRHTLLPLDDCLYALQPTIPHLTRSALHRCLQRHGISRLPEVEGDKPKRQRFKRYPIGFFHMDIAEVQTAEGKLYLFVAIDRTSKFAVTQLVEKADRRTAWEFLEHLLEAVPYRIHTILTDNGIQFAEQPRNRNTAYSRQMRFDMICEANGIEHRLTKPNHPWTNGQVERMNRTIKEATVKRYHYDSHDQLRTHLADFMAAYNFARRLKTLSGLTPYEYICKIWTSEPDRFIVNPIHQMPGLNTQQFWPGSAVHGAFEGLQTINLTFCLAVAPGHLDSVFYRIEIPVQCACEAHDGRQVGFDRVVDPCRERVCLAATQDTVEPHDEAAHRCEGGRASLERVDFPRLIRGEFSAGFDTQRCRDDRGDRVPRFRVPDRFQDLVLQGRALRLLFGSAPPRQQPLQMRRAPLVATLSDQTEHPSRRTKTWSLQHAGRHTAATFCNHRKS